MSPVSSWPACGHTDPAPDMLQPYNQKPYLKAFLTQSFINSSLRDVQHNHQTHRCSYTSRCVTSSWLPDTHSLTTFHLQEKGVEHIHIYLYVCMYVQTEKQIKALGNTISWSWMHTWVHRSQGMGCPRTVSLLGCSWDLLRNHGRGNCLCWFKASWRWVLCWESRW